MNTENFITIRRHANPVDIIGTELTNSAALEQRLGFAHQTIRNTLVKLGHLRRPSHLQWALRMPSGSTTYRVLGVAERTGYYEGKPTYKDITSDAREGKVTLTEDHYLHFAILIGGRDGASLHATAYIQLRYLRNDPIALAQLTRQACYQEESAHRAVERRVLASQLKQLEAERASFERKYTRERAALDAKIATASKPVRKPVRNRGTLVPQR